MSEMIDKNHDENESDDNILGWLKNYTCAASRNTTDRIMVIRAKHTTIV